MKILLRACLESFASRHDKSYKLVFATPELTGEDVKAFGDLLKKEGALFFSEVAIAETDISELDAITEDQREAFGDNAKTKSQRLRATLYRYWESLGAKGSDKDFYDNEMEKIIEHYKSKL